MAAWRRNLLLVLCLLAAATPVVAATQEPKPPDKGLNREQAWEQNERWYEEQLAPIEAKMRKNGDDFQARRISEDQYRKRSAELQEQMEALLRRKEENSLRIVRHFKSGGVAGPGVNDKTEPKPPYKGLNRQQAWEQNERWYEEQLAPIEAKMRKNGDDFQARRIPEDQYRKRSAELQEQMEALLRRKEENSLRIVRHFDKRPKSR